MQVNHWNTFRTFLIRYRSGGTPRDPRNKGVCQIAGRWPREQCLPAPRRPPGSSCCLSLLACGFWPTTHFGTPGGTRLNWIFLFRRCVQAHTSDKEVLMESGVNRPKSGQQADRVLCWPVRLCKSMSNLQLIVLGKTWLKQSVDTHRLRVRRSKYWAGSACYSGDWGKAMATNIHARCFWVINYRIGGHRYSSSEIISYHRHVSRWRWYGGRCNIGHMLQVHLRVSNSRFRLARLIKYISELAALF